MTYEKRIFTLPPKFEKMTSDLLADYGLTLNDSKTIADHILRMSDFYIQNPSMNTPWSEKWAQIAQIAYFFPLNYLRSLAIFKEATERQFPISKSEVLDFGSGLGAGSMPWLEKFSGQVNFVERSSEAQKIHHRIIQSLGLSNKAEWISERQIDAQALRTAIFSYSLTELKTWPEWVWNCDSLILIEPSTRDDGRRLLQKRQELLAKGYSAWAPCPHQQACPLLEQSKHDWCHGRIHLQMPPWFLNIEKHLPMKNLTLTMSYLLVSKTPAPVLNKWRIVGDTLPEKGHPRQLVCRGPKREFLSWMHRNGEAPEIPRGLLIDIPESFEEKSNELRLK
jgi:hypothetical protein